MNCRMCNFFENVGRELYKCAKCWKQICDDCRKKNHLVAYQEDIRIPSLGWYHDECLPSEPYPRCDSNSTCDCQIS